MVFVLLTKLCNLCKFTYGLSFFKPSGIMCSKCLGGVVNN